MESSPEITGNTLRDYLRVLFRQKAVVLTAVLTVVVTVFIGLKFKTNVYEAQVKVLVSSEKQVQSIYYRDIMNARTEVTLTQGEIVRSGPVIERTVRALGLDRRPFDYEAKFCSPWKKPVVEFFARLRTDKFKKFPVDMTKAYFFQAAVENLKGKIKVDPIRDTNTFTISVRDFDPVGAALTANTVSRSYLIYDLEQQLAEIQLKYGEKHPSFRQLQDNISELAKTLNGQPVSIRDALGTASSKVVEQASVPIEPAGVSKALTFLLGVIMSLFLGVMLAFVFEYMDHTFKTPRELETVLDLPFLGSVPKKRGLKVAAVQTLTDQIFLLMKDKGLKSIMVAGIDIEGGSAVVVSILAKELAVRSGRKVLMIDADLRSRQPRAWNKAWDVQPGGKSKKLIEFSFGRASKRTVSPGLAEILEGKTNFEACVKKTGDLAVLTSGQTALNPVTLIDSSVMRGLLKTVKDAYDLVFINVPPLMPFKDGEIASAQVDGVVIVVTEGKTRRPVALAAVQPLRDRKANLIGTVLNDRTFSIPKFLYNRI